MPVIARVEVFAAVQQSGCAYPHAKSAIKQT